MGVNTKIIIFLSLLVCLVFLTSSCSEWISEGSDEPQESPMTCVQPDGMCIGHVAGQEVVCPDGYYFNAGKSCGTKKRLVSEMLPPARSPTGAAVGGSGKVCCWKTQCNNGRDDDGDGYIDGDDDGCYGINDNIELIDCQDNLDDDGDGYTDDEDPGCYKEEDGEWRYYPLQEAEFFITDCLDGIDNDGDGLRNFHWDCLDGWDPGETCDPGCSWYDDDSELNPDIECDDGVNNDGQSGTDYRIDPETGEPAADSDPNCCSIMDNTEQDRSSECKESCDLTYPYSFSEGEELTLCGGTIFDWTDASVTNGFVVNNDVVINCNNALFVGPYDRRFEDRATIRAFAGSGHDNVIIRDCVIRGFQEGIKCTRPRNWLITGCLIEESKDGILMRAGNDEDVKAFTASNNILKNNINSGLQVYYVNGAPNPMLSEILNNEFIGNDKGIYFNGADGGGIIFQHEAYHNYFSGNSKGIVLEHVEGSNIYDNFLLNQVPFDCIEASSNSGMNFCEEGQTCDGVSCRMSHFVDDYTTFLLHFEDSLVSEPGSQSPSSSEGVTFSTYTGSGSLKGAYIDDNEGAGPNDELTYAALDNVNINEGTIEFVVVPNWGSGNTDHKAFFVNRKVNDPKLGIIIGKFYGDGGTGVDKNYLYFSMRHGSGEWSFFEAQTYTREGGTVVEDWVSGEPHYIKAAWSKSSKYLRLYVDGELVGEDKDLDVINWPTEFGNSISIGVGNTGYSELNGIIDELKISNIAR